MTLPNPNLHPYSKLPNPNLLCVCGHERSFHRAPSRFPLRGVCTRCHLWNRAGVCKRFLPKRRKRTASPCPAPEAP